MQAKLTRADEAAARREEAKAKSLEVLQEAREIVALNGNDPERVNKFLKSRHFKELLISLGRKGDMVEADGPRKGRLLLLADLRALYWTHHVPIPPTVPTATTTVSNPANEEESESEYSSDERGMSEAVPFSIRDKVKVWWPAAKNWYRGVVTDVDQVDQTYEVHYQHDDEYFWHDLSWETELLE